MLSVPFKEPSITGSLLSRYITCPEVSFMEPNRTNLLNQLIFASGTETQCFPMLFRQFHGIQCINVIVHVAWECSFSQGFPMVPGNHVNCFPMIIAHLVECKGCLFQQAFSKGSQRILCKYWEYDTRPGLADCKKPSFPKVF